MSRPNTIVYQNNYVRRSFTSPMLTSGIVKECFKVRIPNKTFSGLLKVTISGSTNASKNMSGVLQKSFNLELAASSVLSQTTLYSDVDGKIAQFFAISDLAYDATSGLFEIKIAKINDYNTAHSGLTVIVEAEGHNTSSTQEVSISTATTYTETYATPSAPYPEKRLITAINDIFVGSGIGTMVKKTIAEFKAILGIDQLPVTGGTPPAFTVDDPNFAYGVGRKITVKFHAQSLQASTLAVNGGVAKPVKKPNGNNLINIPANSVMTFVDDGTNFQLQGEGASGDAVASDLLSGKKMTTDVGEITGTMPNRNGAWTDAVQKFYSGEGFVGAMPALGYYNGGDIDSQGGVYFRDADFSAANFPANKNIFGLQGTMPVRGSEEFAGWRRATTGGQLSINGRVHLKIPLGAYLTGVATQGGEMGIFADDDAYHSSNFPADVTIFGLQGSIPRRNGHTQSVTFDATSAAGRIYVRPLVGLYDGADDFVYIDDPDFLSANLLSNKNVFGLQGSIPIMPNDGQLHYTSPDCTVGIYSGDGKNYAYLRIPTNSYTDVCNWAQIYQPDLRPENFPSDKTLMSMQGTMKPHRAGGPNSHTVGIRYSADNTRLYITPEAGYYDGGWTFTYADHADFIQANILSTASPFGLTGTVPVRTNTDTGGTYPLASGDSTYDGVIHLMPPRGYYNGNVWLRFLMPTLAAANIKKGIVIGGSQGGAITGTLEPLQSAQGTFSMPASTNANDYTTITTNLAFIPKMIVVMNEGGSTLLNSGGVNMGLSYNIASWTSLASTGGWNGLEQHISSAQYFGTVIESVTAASFTLRHSYAGTHSGTFKWIAIG